MNFLPVQLLYSKKSFFTLLLIGILFVNCSKTSNVKWMYYNETQCADKWPFDLNNEKLKQNVTDYLKTKGIKVLEIEIYVDGTAEACTACECKTGRRVKCKVKKREEDNMKGEGFY